ncbi:MAG: hypothetical protein ACKVJ3_06945, partial [bacterium]
FGHNAAAYVGTVTNATTRVDTGSGTDLSGQTPTVRLHHGAFYRHPGSCNHGSHDDSVESPIESCSCTDSRARARTCVGNGTNAAACTGTGANASACVSPGTNAAACVSPGTNAAACTSTGTNAAVCTGTGTDSRTGART